MLTVTLERLKGDINEIKSYLVEAFGLYSSTGRICFLIVSSHRE